MSDAAATTSFTQREWLINWSCTVIPRTQRWISVRIVRRTVASFSGLNVDNLISRTFINSEVLTSWIHSSTTMKRPECSHVYNTTVISELSMILYLTVLAMHLQLYSAAEINSTSKIQYLRVLFLVTFFVNYFIKHIHFIILLRCYGA